MTRIPTTIVFFIFLNSIGFSNDCNCCLKEQYFNDDLIYFYTNFIDDNGLSNSHPLIFSYSLNTSCTETPTQVDYEYSITAPSIGITTFETYYSGSLQLNSDNYPLHINNLLFTGGIGPDMTTNKKGQLLAQYLSQSGSLPNGLYRFSLKLKSNSTTIYTVNKTLEISIPLNLDLLYPGGDYSEISTAFTFNPVPLFSWYVDYCPSCEYSIRICEYNPNVHQSLEDALSGESLVPLLQSEKYFSVGMNTHSFQYPLIGHENLEVGKYYVWQVRRSMASTVGEKYHYSIPFVFEVRAADKLQLDYTDPYLSVIEELIGEEQFTMYFSTGGDLERFTTHGTSIWINEDEMHIESLYELLSELKQKKIKVTDLKIK
ncbi:MAG: hypothetical protein QGF36_05345 [Candidatus Marinimicrobia bacterium]|nr:hypothetical protein [Candidatus Neomarinimicrobiota bacterium]